MKSAVLIAYCTRSGSTAEVAHSIAETIKNNGLSVVVKPTAEVDAIPPGAAVVLGTALYVGHFPKEFHRFLDRFEGDLSMVRPWIFALGPTEKERKQFAAAEEQARKEIGKHRLLHPAEPLPGVEPGPATFGGSCLKPSGQGHFSGLTPRPPLLLERGSRVHT